MGKIQKQCLCHPELNCRLQGQFDDSPHCQQLVSFWTPSLMIGLLTPLVRPSAARSEAMLNSINHEVGVVSSILRSISVSPGSPIRLQPATILETSRQFFPETYTIESQVPSSCLVVIAAYEQSSSARARTNICKVLYRKTPRHWLWLTLSIEIPCTSRYWPMAKTQRGTYRKWQIPIFSAAAKLPYSLNTKIHDHLQRNLGIEDATELSLSLSNDDTSLQKPRGDHKATLSTICEKPTPPMDAMNSLHDWQCRRFVESQVTQLEQIETPHCFASSVNGILVYEIKCREHYPSSEFLYNIKALHCMDGTPGFAKFVGVVTDDKGKYLKSYLLEFPRARWNLIQLAATPSMWERREKWAFQVVRGLSQIHRKGFVVGGIVIWAIPVVIENTDSVQFWYFKKHIVAGRTVGAYYPPEFHYVRDMSQTTDAAGCPRATSKMDIFHLGLLLWLIAENGPITRASPVCMRRRCDSAKDCSCDLTHAEPIALPRLPESIPQYFRDMVDDCRAENPSDRPAAWELLQRFPATSDSLQQPELSVPQVPHSPASSTLESGLRPNTVACSNCEARQLQFPIFHCKICDMDDFDLCQTCFEAGGHCYDEAHFLVELGKMGSLIVPRKYHSCVKNSGVRDVLEL